MSKQWNAFDKEIPIDRQAPDKRKKNTRYIHKCDHCNLTLEFQPYWCPACKDHARDLFMTRDRKMCWPCRDKAKKGLEEWITTNLWIPAWLPQQKQ